MLALVLVMFANAIEQRPAPTIGAIYIQGAKQLNPVGIRNLTGLKVGGPATKAVLDQAARNLRSTGNFGVQRLDRYDKGVKLSTVRTLETVDVYIDVLENPVVTGFEIINSGPIGAAEILKVLQTKPGQMVNNNILQVDFENLRALYSSRGYHASVRLNPKRLSVGVLSLQIDIVRIREYRFKGASKALQDLILTSVRLKPGAFYNVDVYMDDLRKIGAICKENGLKGYSVGVYTAPAGRGQPDVMTITLDFESNETAGAPDTN